MRILLSPAKKMRRDPDSLPCADLPRQLPQARQVLQYLRGLSPEALKALWNCSDSIAEQNIRRLREMDLESGLTPAILAYDGIAYQHMAPGVFTEAALSYVQENLRILSGFYGVLRPMDGVAPYRLEMQADAQISGTRNLYEFWGSSLYEASRDPSGIFLNLASKEYSKAIVPYLTPEDRWIHCTFCEMVRGKLTQKATFAKMARGEMVRYLAEQQARDPSAMEGFRALGYCFREDLSSPTEYIFERHPESD